MTVVDQYGTCTNIGNCSKADARQKVVLPVGDVKLCDECGRQLIKVGTVSNRDMERPPVFNRMIVGLGAIGVVGIVGLSVFWMGPIGGTPAMVAASGAEPSSPVAAPVTPSVSSSVSSSAPVPTVTNDVVTLLTLSGSNSLGSTVARDWVEGFLKQAGFSNIRTVSTDDQGWEISGQEVGTQKRSRILLKNQGTRIGVLDLIEGRADLVLADRALGDQEVARLGGKSELTEVLVAIDGVALINHPNNPVNKLNLAQIAELYAGKITNWSQVGGENMPVTLYGGDLNSGTLSSLKNFVLDPVNLDLSTSLIRMQDEESMANLVSRTPGALAVIGIENKNIAKIIALGQGQGNYILPNQLTLAANQYPLPRRLFIDQKNKTNNGMAKKFIDYVLSQKGQEQVTERGLLSIEENDGFKLTDSLGVPSLLALKKTPELPNLAQKPETPKPDQPKTDPLKEAAAKPVPKPELAKLEPVKSEPPKPAEPVKLPTKPELTKSPAESATLKPDTNRETAQKPEAPKQELQKPVQTAKTPDPVVAKLPEPAKEPEAKPLSETTVSARPISAEPLVYPKRLMEMGREGIVEVDCTVETDGSTSGCAVEMIKGPEGFGPPALTFAQKAKFAPATKNGAPVRTEHHKITVQFTIRQ